MFTDIEFSLSSRQNRLRSEGVSQAGKPQESDEIVSRMLWVRGAKVLLDSDLAELYGVTTKRLNEQIRRNPLRFPSDFVFQLTDQELGRLRSQFATSNPVVSRGGRRYLPYAFTEHGSLMAASVLSSTRAVEVSIYVVRAFVSLRRTLAAHKSAVQRGLRSAAKIDVSFGAKPQTNRIRNAEVGRPMAKRASGRQCRRRSRGLTQFAARLSAH
jgi:hypothetical protein